MNRKLENWYRWQIEGGSFKHFVEYIKLEAKRMRKWSRIIRGWKR